MHPSAREQWTMAARANRKSVLKAGVALYTAASTAPGGVLVSIVVRADFSVGGGSSRGDMSPIETLSCHGVPTVRNLQT
jgi:hypothetical protein